MLPFRKIIATLGFLACSLGIAHAESPNERAMKNSLRIIEHLHSVMADQIDLAMATVVDGTFKRVAPEQPVWILETINGTIMYYQGEPKFKGQPADKLVDDAGGRFGLKGLQYGRSSKSGWISLSLGGKGYRAYCKSQYPMVVCSLVAM